MRVSFIWAMVGLLLLCGCEPSDEGGAPDAQTSQAQKQSAAPSDAGRSNLLPPDFELPLDIPITVPPVPKEIQTPSPPIEGEKS